ncbi:NAD(P)-binding domain protein [Niveomyces insectorum RCEF 264]|uniref:NAD(P)-binding domain protein n=1 Tax=Niveomyces insectorum RCEF 264 TaxID=1081102 RepID=A0A168ACF0_9HYPO|nr:NAD(P)-binding domain protein [Niveomyces insectorum RCEF 264]
MSSPVWLVTGVSHGFGEILAHQVLGAGHRLIGTVRNKTKAAKVVQEIEAKGGKIIELDSTESQSNVIAKVEAAVQIYGHVDILVNNAGYAGLGVMEALSEDGILRQFKTNVFGPLYVIQGVLPSMRNRKSGMIVNVSSYAGIFSSPATGLYASSKFALEAVTESMAAETAAFGIKWLLPEFGTFRTNLLGKDARTAPEKGMPAAYKGTDAEKQFDVVTGWDQKQLGDPFKGVQRLFDIITSTGDAVGLRDKVLRVPIGADSISIITQKIGSVKHDLDLAKALEEAHSTAV